MTPGGGGGLPTGGQGLPTGGQGSKVYVLCAEPKEHKHFRPGTRPGGSGTRGDREIVYMPNVYVPFPALIFRVPECGSDILYFALAPGAPLAVPLYMRPTEKISPGRRAKQHLRGCDS